MRVGELDDEESFKIKAFVDFVHFYYIDIYKHIWE